MFGNSKSSEFFLARLQNRRHSADIPELQQCQWMPERVWYIVHIDSAFTLCFFPKNRSWVWQVAQRMFLSLGLPREYCCRGSIADCCSSQHHRWHLCWERSSVVTTTLVHSHTWSKPACFIQSGRFTLCLNANIILPHSENSRLLCSCSY